MLLALLLLLLPDEFTSWKFVVSLVFGERDHQWEGDPSQRNLQSLTQNIAIRNQGDFYTSFGRRPLRRL